MCKCVGQTFLIGFEKQNRHKRIGFDLNAMQQSTCLVNNTITVDNFAAFFNCTPVDRASNSMMAST